MDMTIIEHYRDDESSNRNDRMYYDYILPFTVFWSVVTFVMFMTILSDWKNPPDPPDHPEYVLEVSGNPQ